MLVSIVVIFIVAYAAIALEHPTRIDKGTSALLGAGLLWTVYAVFGGDHALIGNQLNGSVASTAQIVFFLIGAMTIVEVIDAHNGFAVITSQIHTKKQTNLMWIVCFVTFFLSAVLDNLTTTIVMISLMKKLSRNRTVCVPKILSGFIEWWNRLDWRNGCADLLCSGCPGLAIQVEEPA